MQTANKRISSVGNDSKQRRQTISSDRFQKLGHKSDDNAPSTSSRDGKREGEHRFKRLMSSNERAKHFQTRNNMASNGDWSRKMTINSDKFMQIIQKTGSSQRNSKAMSMSVAASNKANILDLLQDINSVDIGQVKNPDEDCEMVTAIDADSLTKIQFQLLEAARTNRCDIIQMIIDTHGCRLDVKNNLDRTALHLAAAQGCFDAVVLLVNNRAPVDLPDKHGMSPMFWAAYNDHVDIVIYLIKHGASVQRKTKRGFTLLHVLAKSDSIKTLEVLVRSKVIRNFQELDLNDYTPLMVATISGSLRATTVLSRIGSLESHLDKNKKNIFHLAVLSECPPVLEQLCKHEEMPKLINAFDNELMAPIHYAIDLDDIESAQVLLKYQARVNIKSKNAPYPLITASQRGNIEMMNLLLENKAKIGKANFAGNTPLHIACMANEVEAARFLLGKGANIMALNKRLQTPFNAAVEQGSAEVCELLIIAGAPINKVDRAAKTPLMLSALSGFVRIVDMIIKAERFRAAEPEFAALLAKKYCRKWDKQEFEEDSEEEDDERMEESENASSTDFASPQGVRNRRSSVSISEASTYVSTSESAASGKSGSETTTSSESNRSFNSSNKDDTDDDSSSSRAESDSSNSDESVEENATKNKNVHSEEPQLDGEDSVFNIQPQYQKADSVFSSFSGTGSNRQRMIEKSKQQKAAAEALNKENPQNIPQKRIVSFENGDGNSAVSSKPPLADRITPSPRAMRSPNNKTPPDRQTPSPLTECPSVFCPEVRFLVNTQSYAGRFQTLFFYIAHKKLRRSEWKSLAKHWNFTEEQVEAIELQHKGGKNAYKEHGFRLLCIWMHGLSENTDPAPLLYTALTSIGRKMEANNVQKDFYKATHGQHSRKDDCHIS
ncbi:unnamed protein product [Hymenolepis diminuta]|uniref:Death domain-containing protein n=2 Tax=Hymenolepis diminuta TaxID=6216 RepID=A0A564YCQ9_HYMDI|nr:unnamed protein product [Hymenolepis diminuta]